MKIDKLKYILAVAIPIMVYGFAESVYRGRTDEDAKLLKEGQEWVFERREDNGYSLISGPRRLARIEGDTVITLFDGYEFPSARVNVYDEEGNHISYFFHECDDSSVEHVFWGNPEEHLPNENFHVQYDQMYNDHDGRPWFTTLESWDAWVTDYSCSETHPADIVEFDGSQLRRWYYPSTEYNKRKCVVEGIGVSLYSLYYSWRQYAYDAVVEVHLPGASEPFTETMFLRGIPSIGISDSEEAFYWPEMIRDDRVWVYGCLDEESNSYFESFCRFGEWERVGMCMYRPFYEYKRICWPDVSDRNSFTVDEGGNIPTVMLRESLGRVHVPNDHEVTEGILYDFNLDCDGRYRNTASGFPVVQGDDFISEANDYTWENKEYSYVAIDGEKRLKQVYTNQDGIEFEFIEGIGVTNRGFLSHIYGSVSSDTSIPRLYRYCDADESVIHQFRKSPFDIASVSAPDSRHRNDGRIYDIHGQVVMNPVSGSIYIQNGKKILWNR